MFMPFRLNPLRWIKSFIKFQSTQAVYSSSMVRLSHCEIDKYDCVGFDLDHTLCRYHLRPLFRLIYETLADFLVERHGYPTRISQLSDQDMSFAQKGIVLDKSRGNFLKLDSDYHIIKATHGTRPLSDSEVLQIYGPERIWEKTHGIPSKLIVSNALQEPFYVFKDYFVTPGAAICAKMIDCLDEEQGHRGQEYHFWDQYIEGVLYMYERENFQKGSGCFFPELIKNPNLYMQRSPACVKKWLEEVSKKKVMFLLTSANCDAADFIARFSLGDDWRKYFRVIITFARKPGFFWKRKPFHVVRDGIELNSVLPEDMKNHTTYSQGNYADLHRLFAKLSQSENPKTLYFGDSLLEDVCAASQFAKWDTVALVEELFAERTWCTNGTESVELASDFWNSFFGDHSERPTLWSRLLREHSTMVVPSLEAFVQGLEEDPVEVRLPNEAKAYSRESTATAYFTGMPKSLPQAPE